MNPKSILKVLAITAFAFMASCPVPLHAGTSTNEISTPEKTAAQSYLPVAASTKIYKGTMVALNSSGYVVAASDTANLKVVGRAEQTVDNSSGSNGAVSVQIRRGVFFLNNSGTHAFATTDTGKTAYVEDDHTASSQTTNYIEYGVIDSVTSSGVWVVVNAKKGSNPVPTVSLTQDTLTDSSGGTASTTIAAITAGGSYAQADLVALKNAVASFAAENAKIKADIAAIKAALITAGVFH